MKAILSSPFTCVYTTLTATILEVTFWHMESAVALKCNGNGLESLLAGLLEKSSVHWRGPGM